VLPHAEPPPLVNDLGALGIELDHDAPSGTHDLPDPGLPPIPMLPSASKA
jgi:hypothetical protein